MPRRVFAPLICLSVVASLAFGQQANSLAELSLEQNKLSAKLSYTPGRLIIRSKDWCHIRQMSASTFRTAWNSTTWRLLIWSRIMTRMISAS